MDHFVGVQIKQDMLYDLHRESWSISGALCHFGGNALHWLSLDGETIWDSRLRPLQSDLNCSTEEEVQIYTNTSEVLIQSSFSMSQITTSRWCCCSRARVSDGNDTDRPFGGEVTSMHKSSPTSGAGDSSRSFQWVDRLVMGLDALLKALDVTDCNM